MKTTRGETLISVVIGMFILTIIILGIVRILSTNYTIEDVYQRNNMLFLLQNNATNIVKHLDTTSLKEGDLFYIYRCNTGTCGSTPSFQIFTGSTGGLNEQYKYIDKNGDMVTNTGTYDGTIYTRIFYVDKNDPNMGPQNQVIRGAVKELIRK